MVGRDAGLNARPNLFDCCFTWIGGVEPKGTDPRQTKVGPEEKIPPLSCGARHEHEAPTQSNAHQLGTVRWACVRQENVS